MNGTKKVKKHQIGQKNELDLFKKIGWNNLKNNLKKYLEANLVWKKKMGRGRWVPKRLKMGIRQFCVFQ